MLFNEPAASRPGLGSRVPSRRLTKSQLCLGSLPARVRVRFYINISIGTWHYRSRSVDPGLANNIRVMIDKFILVLRRIANEAQRHPKYAQRTRAKRSSRPPKFTNIRRPRDGSSGSEHSPICAFCSRRRDVRLILPLFLRTVKTKPCD